MAALGPHLSALEYVDPYEHNETFIASFPEHITPQTTHMEVHPSSMMSLLTSMIPYANHNQSPRNQLSCSQSKQGVSIYATNWKNRYDNSGHILCYPEAPNVRTMYYDYAAEGRIGYGANIILALAPFDGYNQEDGIVFNKQALERGLFRTIAYRSYEFFEEDDDKTGAKTRIGNPAQIGGWLDLRPGLDYTKLDDRGIVRVGEYVDEDTVICGGYLQAEKSKYKDVSMTPQVWTKGRVESVVVTINNLGLRLVKIRVVQDRTPELGDKFCLTPDHEVLTVAGWKCIADVTEQDKVCTLTTDGNIEYQNPTGMYAFNCDNEEMYKLQSQQCDLVTTMNHKMYIKKRNAKVYTLEPAKDIIGKRVQYKKNGTNTNKDYLFALDQNNHHSAHNPELNMDAFLEFLGYWISDGWVCNLKHSRADGSEATEHRIELSLHQKDISHVTNLITKMGYNSYTNKENNKIFINSEQLGKYLKQFSNGAANKCLPEWTWELSERQCRVLLKGLIGGDGTVTNSGSERFFTTSTKLADQFQQLCLHAGWSANKTKEAEAGTKIVICGKQTQLNADYWSLGINKSKNEPMINHGHSKTQSGQSETIIKYTGSVHCIEVPSHIFYVRHNGKCVWTGNSNRHGQKGTMGMMFNSWDMPRTADGVVPDIIVNPHSIPSRMTIAQMLEQILGKLAGVHGAIGDATTFMNEGSPAEAIGNALESYGFERTGNEILYDGRSGSQIPTAMFIAPVYAMRLKHMVEDKWQARTTGRKEMRTHQPTGGRGKEGGLRFGELERDAVITHGISAFIRESTMKRSDGTTLPICTGCGTLPIYNERLGISVCPVCQGPLKYSGTTTDTLELIPPLTKPIAPIVKVEMPYVVKLLNQELNTFMAGGFRFLTSGGGVQHLNAKPDLKNKDATIHLSERIIPDSEVPAAPALAEEEGMKNSIVPPAASLTDLVELAKRAGMTLVPTEAAMRMNAPPPQPPVTPTLDLDDLEVQTTDAGLPAASVNILPGAFPENQGLQVLGVKEQVGEQPLIVQGMPAAQSAMNANQSAMNANQSAMPIMTTESLLRSAAGPTIVVDTSPRALAGEGLILEDTGVGGMNAGIASPTLRVRRSAGPRRSVSFGGDDEGSAAPAPKAASGSTNVTVNKLG
jgi:hypothetical protein